MSELKTNWILAIRIDHIGIVETSLRFSFFSGGGRLHRGERYAAHLHHNTDRGRPGVRQPDLLVHGLGLDQDHLGPLLCAGRE